MRDVVAIYLLSGMLYFSLTLMLTSRDHKTIVGLRQRRRNTDDLAFAASVIVGVTLFVVLWLPLTLSVAVAKAHR